MWAPRDQRMLDDQRAWELRPLMLDASKGEQSYRLNRCTTDANKAVQMMLGAELRVQVPARGDDDRDLAQRIEDGCRAFRDEVLYRYNVAINQTFDRDVCHDLIVLGWGAVRLLGDQSDPAFPWTVDVLNPMDIYPIPWDGPADCYVHIYATTAGALKARWGKLATKAVGEQAEANPNTPVTAYGFYSATEMALLANHEWIKKPTKHNYGFCPLIVVLANGNPHRQPRDVTTSFNNSSDTTLSVAVERDDWPKFVGTSFLHALRPVVDDMQQVVMIQRKLLAKAADPPVWSSSRDPISEDDIPTEPGEHNSFPLDTQIHDMPPVPAALASARDMVAMGTDNANRAGIGPQLYGMGQGASGFQDATNIGTATDVLDPFMAAYSLLWQRVFRAWLKLFAAPWQADAWQFVAPDRQTGLAGYQQLAPLDVLGRDFGVQVTFGSLSPVDKVAMGNLANALMQSGALDYETALGDLMGMDNPIAIRRRAIRDQADKDPIIGRLRAYAEKAQDTTDPMGASVAAQLYQVTLTQVAQKLTQDMLAAQGLTPAGTPQAPGSGMPNPALPGELGTEAGLAPNAGAPPGMAQLGAGVPQAPAGLPVG